MGRKMIVFTGLLIGGLYLYGYLVIPGYRIKSSVSFESPSGWETVLSVVVYRNYHDDELMAEIEKFYLDINGYPSALQMELYFDGQKEPYRTERFEY